MDEQAAADGPQDAEPAGEEPYSEYWPGPKPKFGTPQYKQFIDARADWKRRQIREKHEAGVAARRRKTEERKQADQQWREERDERTRRQAAEREALRARQAADRDARRAAQEAAEAEQARQRAADRAQAESEAAAAQAASVVADAVPVVRKGFLARAVDTAFELEAGRFGLAVSLARGTVGAAGQSSGRFAGSRARVETSGEIHRRVTVTRLVLLGPFAQAVKKRQDDRSMFLTVEGVDFELVVQVDPKREADARRFAADFNTRAARA